MRIIHMKIRNNFLYYFLFFFDRIPADAQINTCITTEGLVHHMELDSFIPGNLLYTEASQLTTTDGEATNLVSGEIYTCR